MLRKEIANINKWHELVIYICSTNSNFSYLSLAVCAKEIAMLALAYLKTVFLHMLFKNIFKIYFYTGSHWPFDNGKEKSSREMDTKQDLRCIHLHTASLLNRLKHCFVVVGFQRIQKLLSESHDRCWNPNAGALPFPQWSLRILMPCILIVTAAEWNEGASKSKSFSSEHRAFLPSVIFFQGYCFGC